MSVGPLPSATGSSRSVARGDISEMSPTEKGRTASGPSDPAGGGRGPWAALLVLCLANFLILLDTSIVNTAAPAMMQSLDAGIDSVLWVLNGYLLALACLLILFGRLGDLAGPRTIFVAGLALFTVASVLCGLSGTPAQLVAARVLQGIGAAGMLPQAITLITLLFPAGRRGAAFGIFTAVAGVAAVSGPTVGGLVVTEFGWPWIFYLNLPLGVAGIVLGRKLVSDQRPPRPKGFDLIGVLLVTAALTGIVYALVQAQPWAAVAALPFGISFMWWERRHPHPLVPFALFKIKNFLTGTHLVVVNSFALYGFLLVFVIQTQTLQGMSALQSGLSALPWTLTLCAVAPLAGRLTDRLGGRRLLVSGLALNALGVALFATGPPALVLIGLGMGAAIAPTTTEAMRHVPTDRVGAASGVLNTARQVGAALGAAVIGMAMQSSLPATTPALGVVAGVLLAGSALALLVKP